MGSGDLRGQNWEIHDAQIGWSSGIEPWEKTLRSPAASMGNWRIYMRAYQFLGNPAISHEQIMAPHFRGGLQEAAAQADP